MARFLGGDRDYLPDRGKRRGRAAEEPLAATCVAGSPGGETGPARCCLLSRLARHVAPRPSPHPAGPRRHGGGAGGAAGKRARRQLGATGRARQRPVGVGLRDPGGCPAGQRPRRGVGRCVLSREAFQPRRTGWVVGPWAHTHMAPPVSSAWMSGELWRVAEPPAQLPRCRCSLQSKRTARARSRASSS